MKICIFTVILSGFTFCSCAQSSLSDTSTKKNDSSSFRNSSNPLVKYILPGGEFIIPEKLDSVIKAWEDVGTSVMYISRKDQPGVIYLIAADSASRMAGAEKREKLLKTLLNKPAPDFALTDLQGRSITLYNLKNKVIVLNFWYTSCSPCIAEMPDLNRVKNKYDSSKVVFLGLATDGNKKVKSFLKSHVFNYTLLPDAQKVNQDYKVSAWPTSIVIDKKGIVRFIQVGGNKIGDILSSVINTALN